MHEIITLQFGQRANYLATHFWNLQESYFTYAPNTEPSIVDHDIHFRPGIGTDGSDTYTPRTVIYDLKGGFGSLKQINALYDDVGDSDIKALWEGTTTIQRQQPIVPTTYQQNLDLGLPTHQLHDDEVRYWSDFNRVYFHPRSIVQLNEYSLNSQIAPFDNWATGEELFRDIDREVDILDRDTRPFVEEADHLQGFQIFSSVDDAWGGFTSKFVDALRDEFGKNAIWVWGVEDGRREERSKMLNRAANSARSMRAVAQQASAYVRLSTSPTNLPEYINAQSRSEWATSALLTTAIESIMLPTRLRRTGLRQGSMGLFQDTLNTNGNQTLFELSMSIRPGGERTDTTTTTNNNNTNSQANSSVLAPPDPLSLDVDFTPQIQELTNTRPRRSTEQFTHVFSQINSHRGPKRSLSTTPPRPTNTTTHLESLQSDLPIVESYLQPLAFPTLDTFPDTLYTFPRSRMSVSSALTNRSSTKARVWALRDRVMASTRSVEAEEREALYNDLTELGEGYAFGWDSGGDDSADD